MLSNLMMPSTVRYARGLSTSPSPRQSPLPLLPSLLMLLRQQVSLSSIVSLNCSTTLSRAFKVRQEKRERVCVCVCVWHSVVGTFRTVIIIMLAIKFEAPGRSSYFTILGNAWGASLKEITQIATNLLPRQQTATNSHQQWHFQRLLC